MKRSLFNRCAYLSLMVLAFVVSACEGVRMPVTSEPAISGQPVGEAKGALLLDVAAALPNLRIEGIRHTASVGSDGTCSVVFYCTVGNRGAAMARSFVVGMRGWGTQTILTCTGTWQATNTTTDLAAGSSRSVLIYGPGYVGPRVRKGTYLTVTAYADTYCAVGETSEYDNSLTQTIRVGY